MATGEEIKAAREARGLSQADLAEAIGISQPAIKKIESGETLRSKFMPEIEEFLRLGKSAQPQSEGIYRPPPQFMNYLDPIPVYASAEGGNGHLIVSHDEIGRAPRPQVLEGIKDAYAILITGSSMVPAYKPGDRAWVNPTLPAARDTDNIFYAVDDSNGEAKATIKELSTWSDAEWTVKQHNPAKTFKLDRGVWGKRHRVVGNFRGR